MTITIYGIKNCDTMKKARTWLDAHNIEYRFNDYKLEGVSRDNLINWCVKAGWETVLNRAGTTFRALDDLDKRDLDTRKAIDLMLAHPSMIKRPVLEAGDRLLIGFKPELYSGFFGDN